MIQQLLDVNCQIALLIENIVLGELSVHLLYLGLKLDDFLSVVVRVLLLQNLPIVTVFLQAC